MDEIVEEALAELWEAAGRNDFSEERVLSTVEKLMKDNGIGKEGMILDACGGYGFPSIDLALRGYQVIYNDASLPMFNRMMKNAEEAGAPSYIYALAGLGDHGIGTSPWQHFGRFSGGMFDMLICKGNSLPYVASWGKEGPALEGAREKITDVLSGQFYRILKKGGVLYVDKQPEGQVREEKDIGAVDLWGRKVLLTTESYNDKEGKVRHWTLKTRDAQTGEENTYPSEGYLLLEDELVGMLYDAGFRNVEKHVLAGDVYEGFTARKS